MGLDNFTDGNTGLSKIDTIEKAKDAVVEVNSIVEGPVKQEDFNNHRKDIGYSTRCNGFKRMIGMTFNEVKREAGIGINKNMQRCSDLSKYMSRDKAYVYGVLLGDASIYELEDRGKFIELAVKDKEFAVKFGKSLCSLFDLEWDGWRDRNTGVQMNKKDIEDDNVSDLYIVKKGIGQHNYDKINRDIDRSSNELVNQCGCHKVHLLEGLWDSEGSIRSDNGIIKFTNTDKKILKLYIHLLSKVLNDVEIDSVSINNSDSSQKIDAIRINKQVSSWDEREDSTPKTDITLPAEYRCEFYNKLDICIERKENIFEDYCN